MEYLTSMSIDPSSESPNVVQDSKLDELELADANYSTASVPNDTLDEAELSRSETKEIVTPYAFTVSPHLLGKPLATPKRRAFAILIDVFLISVLSTISSLIFAAFVAITFFRADSRLKKKAETGKQKTQYTRVILRGSGAIIIFFVAFMVVKGFDGNDSAENAINPETGIKIAEVVILLACNDDLECLQNAGIEIAESLAETDITLLDFKNEIASIVSETPWSEDEKAATISLFEEAFMVARNSHQQLVQNSEVTPKPTLDDAIAPQAANTTMIKPVENEGATPSSVIGWINGLMSDLGLGLGWAALYFSVFTAWANGQTIGKKICGIKVVKLDGNVPNLWESFGRYGGYGAGFATGLLGFLQLYWDPNRQAIQDKISETLVLRV